MKQKIFEIEAADLQMLKNEKNNGKYWSSYVQWRNLIILTPYIS